MERDVELPAAVRRWARAAVPERFRPRIRRMAERRGWVQPIKASPEADPFEYPYWEIMQHFETPYPQYLWGTMCAAGLAAALGHARTSVIEFGVAGGNGLVELERVATWVAARSRVGIDVYGFDTGTGLPAPVDYRDLPNLWSEGNFAMEPGILTERLKAADLRLGPVSETVREFVTETPAPIGFVAFDLDMYSSTTDAFHIFRDRAELLLPRVVCYFDDIIGFSHSDFTGERLAIGEFNQISDRRKISKLYGLRYVVAQDMWWTDMMYMLHAFDHPRYNERDGTNRLRELPLAGTDAASHQARGAPGLASEPRSDQRGR